MEIDGQTTPCVGIAPGQKLTPELKTCLNTITTTAINSATAICEEAHAKFTQDNQ